MTKAAAASSLTQARVRLRPTMQSDLDFGLTLEGTLRGPEGFDSLAVLSMLQPDFETRRHGALELVR